MAATPHCQHAPTPASPAEGRGRRLLQPTAALAGAAAYALAVHMVNPEIPGRWPTCPWLLLTGTFCPGCGTLRASAALTNGDVALAWHRNPFAVLALAAMAVGFVRWVRRLWRDEPRQLRAPAWSIYLLFGGVLAFWILRNVPGFEFLGPGR